MAAIKRRNTAQKRLIMEIIEKAREHLSADAVHDAARRRMPRISLGTVYRNLRLLAKEGVLEEVRAYDGRSLFATAKGPHHHIRCLNCGAVIDVELAPGDILSIERYAARASSYVVKSVSVRLDGFCPACQGVLTGGGND